MGQQPRELSPELSPVHKFGAELRRYRTKAGLSMAKLGLKIHFSAETIGRVERGERRPSETLAKVCDQTLDTGGALLELWVATKSARLRAVCQYCGSVLSREKSLQQQLITAGHD